MGWIPLQWRKEQQDSIRVSGQPFQHQRDLQQKPQTPWTFEIPSFHKRLAGNSEYGYCPVGRGDYPGL